MPSTTKTNYNEMAPQKFQVRDESGSIIYQSNFLMQVARYIHSNIANMRDSFEVFNYVCQKPVKTGRIACLLDIVEISIDFR